jgi:putative glycosyltransferase (TIGR04348 family)
MLPKPHQRITIITPALADAKNGNWQTAKRWSLFIDKQYQTEVSKTLDTKAGQKEIDLPDAIIALHARRSASIVKEFAATGRPIAVVLTGTDLYGDTPGHPEVAQSLDLASQIVVLQEDAMKLLPKKWHSKTRVIYQSANQRKPGPFRKNTFDIAFVAHLRAEKDPDTLLEAFRLCAASNLRLIHIGKLDDYAEKYQSAAATDARISLKGLVDYATARRLQGQCRLLVITSRMEGGANVIIEAITNGTPVIASRISGNVGMLGDDYPGYFEVGNRDELCALITRCAADLDFMQNLKIFADRRANRFLPATEGAAVLALTHDLLGG